MISKVDSTEYFCNTCDAGPFTKQTPGSCGDTVYNTHKKANHIIISFQEPAKSIEQLATEALYAMDPIQKLLEQKELKKQDLLKDILTILEKEILKESDNIILVLLNGLSAYSANPINLRILAPSSEGKTYLVNKVSQLFPKKDVLNLSSASAQSFKYLSGEPVIEDESGNFVPIGTQLIDLELQLNEKSKSKEELDSIKHKIAEIKKKSWHLIDLSNKWLIFSDSQNIGLWEMLKTLLSHDDEYIKHQVTNKIGGKNTTQKIVFKGKPAVTYCSAKDESKYQISEEMDTRFHTIYLKTNPQKYKESIKLLSQQHGLPKQIFEDEVVSNAEKLQAEQQLLQLVENIKQYGANTNPLFNPFAAELSKNFPHESGFRSRQFDRFCQYLSLVTLCYSSSRPKIKIGSNNYPVVVKSDIEKVINLLKESNSISTSKIQFLNDIIRPALISIQDNEDYKVEFATGSKYVMTGSELSEYNRSINKKSNLDRKKILENYLKPLFEHGFLEEAEDPRNRKRHVFWLSKTIEDKEASVESTIIDISTLADSGVRVFIEKYLQHRFDTDVLTILDADGHTITPEQLYKTVTSIDIQTTENSHKNDHVRMSKDVEK